MSFLTTLCSVLFFSGLIIVPNRAQHNLNLTYFLHNDTLLQEGREASKVDPALFAGVNSHAGYISVGEGHNLFFWFFPREQVDLRQTPWILWLQGGPGMSSTVGLFGEIGPLRMENGNVTRMPISWADEYSLLFVDNPVGTGYSFIGPVATSKLAAKHLLIFLEQFVQLFPALQDAPLFVAGQAYGAKFAVQLAYQIHQNRNMSINMNFRGVILADGVIDPVNMLHYAKVGVQLGIWDTNLGNAIANIESQARECYEREEINCYHEKALLVYQFLLDGKYITNLYNILKDDGEDGPRPSYFDVGTSEFLDYGYIKHALHVAEGINFVIKSSAVFGGFRSEYLLPATEKFQFILDKYPVLAYAGQLDLFSGPVVAEHAYRLLEWHGAQDYQKADRYPIVSKYPEETLNPIGYMKTVYNFQTVLIRAAGQRAAAEQPRAVLQVVSRFIYKTLESPSPEDMKSYSYKPSHPIDFTT